MKIETNISEHESVHDLIRFPPIERQVYDFFAAKSQNVTHNVTHGGLTIKVSDMEFAVEIKKKKVRLAMMTPYEARFGEGDYPSIGLPYNKDVTKQVNAFYDALCKISDLHKRANKIKPPDKQKIEAALNEMLGTKIVEISYWNESLIKGIEIVFYAHPKGSAPADGVLLCLNSEHKIEPFWNASTPRRKMHYGDPQLLESAVGRIDHTTVSSLKGRIAAAEEFEAKVNAFDINKSLDLMKLVSLKLQGDHLLKEFRQIKV